LWRLGTKAFDDVRPQTAVVLIGSANLSASQSACAIVAGVTAVVSDIRRRWDPKRVVLIEILPRCKDPAPKLDERLQINLMFQQRFKSDPGVILLNADTALACDSQSGPSPFNDDHIHLTEAGYQALTSQLKTAVK